MEITIKIKKQQLDKAWGLLDSLNQGVEEGSLLDNIIAQLLNKIREAEN